MMNEMNAMKKSGRGMAKADMQKPAAYKKGGSVGSASKRADGIAKKGKTHTKMVAMARGGSCK